MIQTLRRMPKAKLTPEEIRSQYPSVQQPPEYWRQAAESLNANEYWRNDTYLVMVLRSPDVTRVSINRHDKQPIRNWEDFQAIKNQILGPEAEAAELYPAESRLVNQGNQYHLWCINTPGFQFPFGITSGRQVS
jgi:hypothetical protein